MQDILEEGSFDPTQQKLEMTDEQVFTFAKRIYKGEIFVSWLIRESDMHLLSSIFMPLIFLNDVQRKEMSSRGVAHLWAEYKDAGPTAINGYPIFMSLGTLTRSDSERIQEQIRKIIALIGD